jgi:hypothetical protein
MELEAANKKADMDTKAQEFRSQYVSAFLEKALNQDIELRIRLAEYFKYVAQGDDFKRGWEAYYSALENTRKKIRDEIETNEKALAQIQKLAPAQRDYVEEDRLLQYLDWLRGEVGYVASDKSVIRNPRSPQNTGISLEPQSTNISLESIAPERRGIAEKIITAFANAGFGRYQQAAALANAIAESNLNPAIKSQDGGVGLFDLSQKGIGAGHTLEELMDPDTNISLVVAQAKKSSPFVNASTLGTAVETFVRFIIRPMDMNAQIAKRSEIAVRLVQ